MRIAVISDIHLGRGDETDRFGHEAPQFHAFLDHLEQVGERIVLLGDVLDTHHGRIPFAFEREARIVCAAHCSLSDRLLSGRYDVVFGNHDSVLAKRPGVREEMVFYADGYRILMIHGHQFDRLLSCSAGICALGNWLGGVAQRHGIRGALSFLDFIDDFANGVTRDRSERYRRIAVALARRRGFNVIVLGHLHKLEKHEEQGVIYLNTGSCLEGKFEYVLIDTKSGVMEGRRW